MKREKRTELFIKAILTYLDDFCEKHSVGFGSWIDDVGVTAKINGYKISFADIRLDLDYALPETMIWEWSDYKAKYPRAKKNLGYYNYSTGRRLPETELFTITKNSLVQKETKPSSKTLNGPFLEKSRQTKDSKEEEIEDQLPY